MKFRSSYHIFKPTSKSHDFIYIFFKQYFDFKRISKDLYQDYYSLKKNKNTPYDPSSMIRLIFILNIFSKNNKYSPHYSKLDLDNDLVRLCGFSIGKTPTYSTFFYFLKRMKLSGNTLIKYLNKARSLFVKFLFKNFYSKTNKLIFGIDSKPIATDGQHPRGTIYSHNKFLNSKLGIKIHTLSIVYPIIFPIAFAFSPAHHNDSPFLRDLISTIIPIIDEAKKRNITSFLTADKGYYGYENIEACGLNNVIPVISPKKTSKAETYEKFFQYKDKIHCIHSNLCLRKNGIEKQKNRINYICSNKSCDRKCSKRVWIPFGNSNLRKPPNEYFISMNSYLKSSVSEVFKTIYSHRSKTELLHAIWTKSYNLRDTIYIGNFKALLTFELNLTKKITYDSIFTLKSGPYQAKKLWS
ncbi:transposase [uncultured Cetobacterium sp.]|uniref:transposase n=1 Tax=uncultured Cetobacterium sp. TaxID=527638 RepID=UPI00260F3FFE|nr:transposase [uncultured Cetobacterium sp.]